MKRVFEHKLILLMIIATVFVAIIIGLFGKINREVSFIESVGGNIILPAQSAVSETRGFFADIGTYFNSVKTLYNDNERLKNENINLQKQLLDTKGLSDENERLRRMLKLAERETRIDMVAASVVAKDPTNWFSTFTINKGADDGVEINQPIVNSNRELVGQISRVGNNWAEVITILDPQSSVGAMIKRSKEIGIIEGNSALRYEGKCRLDYIARDADVKQGDFVETSGLGGIFPKGLVIGVITEIYDENATMSKAAIVEPVTDIAKLNEVFVIMNYTETDLTETDLYETEQESEENDDNEDEE